MINEHEPVRTVQMPAPRWGETIERRQGGQTNSHPTGERVQIAFVKEFHLYLLPNSICICQPIAFVFAMDDSSSRGARITVHGGEKGPLWIEFVACKALLVACCWLLEP